MKRILLVMTVLVLLCSTGSALALRAGDVVTFGRYEQDYPGQAIEWIVLAADSSTAVLLSRYVLDCRKYDSNSRDWYSSDLCRWLNDQVLNSDINSDERRLLLSDSYGCYINIPSTGVMLNSGYGFSNKESTQDSSRSAYGTAHAIANGLWVKGGKCSYFTSTAANKHDVRQVRTDGSIGVARCDRDNVGVRLMVYIDCSGF